MHISSERDMDEVRKDLDTMSDYDLEVEALYYDKISEEECLEGNYYACDLYWDAHCMFKGELDRRKERRDRQARAAEARKRQQASTIGQRIPPETKDKLIALKHQLECA